MNEDIQQPQQSISSNNDVSFPSHTPKGKSPVIKLLIALVGVLIIVLAGAWFLLRGDSGEDDSYPSPTPYSGLTSFDDTTPEPATPMPTPSETPKPVDKSEIKIEVLNGTGVPGEASFLKKELEKLGYKEIEAGNADSQGETRTTVTFSNSLSESVVSELTKRLEELYTEVRTKKSSSITGGKDIQILTGPRKGASSASASPKATVKPSGSPTASPSATPR